MTTDPMENLDQAVQRYIADNFPGALVTGWILVTHSQGLEDEDQGLSNYRLVTPPNQPFHQDLGLVQIGAHICRDSWDNAWADDDDD